jgi:hypothetical protein
MTSTATLERASPLATAAHVRRTQSCERCGATDARVTYAQATASLAHPAEWLISASCTNETCERFDRRTQRHHYANEALARPAATVA